jgi:hypothetical protein
MDAKPFRQRGDQVARGTGVDHRPFAPVQPDRGGEGPGPRDLHLELTLVAVECLGELVEVLSQQSRGSMGVAPCTVDEPPPHRLQIDRQLGEQPGAPTNDVGSGPTRGKLWQIRESVLAEQVPNG